MTPLYRQAALLLMLPTVAVACSSASSAVRPAQDVGATVSTPSPAPAKAATQEIDLSEWKVAAPTTVKAGQYAYRLVNAGTVQHELLVFRSTLAPAQYPLDASGIVEDGAGITKVSDGDNIDPGKSQSRSVDLSQPGTYLFVCNIPGHFKAGMYTVVTVTP